MHALDTLRGLYPAIEPYSAGTLSVGGGHALYIEQCGRADAPAIVVIHGGPGGACSPAMRRFFDPNAWRVILFDQRGCGRSRPYSALHANTTPHLVDDMERIRRHLGVEEWALFGGSWGSTLALAYAQAHRERVTGLIARGVFLMTPQEIEWFYGGGAGALLPEAWEAFLSHLEPHERDDPIPAYHERLTGKDRARRSKAALAWTAWESDALDPGGRRLDVARRLDPIAADALARLECHYFLNGGFLSDPNQLLDEAHKLKGLPGTIIQGRMDLVTPPRAAYALSRAWPAASLHIVPEAGHAASEPGVIDGLVRATDSLAARLSLSSPGAE